MEKRQYKYLGRHIMVKGKYVELILSGKKTATIRLGLVKPRYKELIVHGGGRPIAKIEIDRITYKRVSELTDEDAIRDGFNSVTELLQELKNVYPELKNDDWVTIIEFHVVQRLDALSPSDPYMGLSPADVARLGLRYLLNELSDQEKEILIELTRTKSIRMTSLRIFGSLEKRYIIRRLLKKVLNKLLDRRLLRSKE